MLRVCWWTVIPVVVLVVVDLPALALDPGAKVLPDPAVPHVALDGPVTKLVGDPNLAPLVRPLAVVPGHLAGTDDYNELLVVSKEQGINQIDNQPVDHYLNLQPARALNAAYLGGALGVALAHANDDTITDLLVRKPSWLEIRYGHRTQPNISKTNFNVGPDPDKVIMLEPSDVGFAAGQLFATNLFDTFGIAVLNQNGTLQLLPRDREYEAIADNSIDLQGEGLQIRTASRADGFDQVVALIHPSDPDLNGAAQVWLVGIVRTFVPLPTPHFEFPLAASATNTDLEEASALAVGDVDGDGDTDVVVGGLWYAVPAVQLLRRTGGALIAELPVPLVTEREIEPTVPQAMVMADLDHDSRQEVAVAGEGRRRNGYLTIITD